MASRRYFNHAPHGEAGIDDVLQNVKIYMLSHIGVLSR